MSDKLYDTTSMLLDYCRKNNWAGFDPYDALNSRVFAATPFSKSRICRIGITQIMKRLPINLRPLLLVSREQNPKAIALFLMALLKLSRHGLLEQNNMVEMMADKLVSLRSKNHPYWCWGYSFPWQTRTILVPRGAPNLICTLFVANALLDAYEENNTKRYLSIALNAAEYIIEKLYWEEDTILGFSYPLPGLRAGAHNANFLAAALLCRVYKHCGEEKFLGPALKVTRYSASKQQDDGSWLYGDHHTQRWVDNFHTGYNLCALKTIRQYADTSEFEPHLRRGFEFYRKHFFMQDNAPKYFHDRAYPLDIHSVAQSIITLVDLKDLNKGNIELAHAVAKWAIKHMWDERGYFYYRVNRSYKDKTSYMRWSQAWMLLALSTLLDHADKVATGA